MWTEPVRDRVFHTKQVAYLEGRENQLNIQVALDVMYQELLSLNTWQKSVGFYG